MSKTRDKFIEIASGVELEKVFLQLAEKSGKLYCKMGRHDWRWGLDYRGYIWFCGRCGIVRRTDNA